MMRVDHWIKNAFMVFGIVLAFLYRPELPSLATLAVLGLAILLTGLVASSNYVLNELLDAPMDRLHPTKKNRPAACGLVHTKVALALWGILGYVGIWGAFQINIPFGGAIFALWIMGCLYNLPPIRTKDIPYLDVVTESINNPIRLFLGWFVLIPTVMPPMSMAISYWMIGAFFMAAKRYAEYRRIGDPARAASYRRSFRHYNEMRLWTSMFFYVSVGSVFAGIFVVRYKLELIFCVPVVALFLAVYARTANRPDSPVQHPEKLYREPLFMVSALAVMGSFLLVMFSDVPMIYELFNVDRDSGDPLWRLGK